MRAGKLRHRVTLQSFDSTQDEFGQPIRSWSTDGTAWASIEPLQGQELVEAQAVNHETTHKITLRYLAVSPQDRLQFSGRTFEPLSVINVDERNVEAVILAKEDL